jgi:hypothetical protein
MEAITLAVARRCLGTDAIPTSGSPRHGVRRIVAGALVLGAEQAVAVEGGLRLGGCATSSALGLRARCHGLSGRDTLTGSAGVGDHAWLKGRSSRFSPSCQPWWCGGYGQRPQRAVGGCGAGAVRDTIVGVTCSGATIRPASEAEIPAVLALWRAVRSATPRPPTAAEQESRPRGH